MKFFIQIILLSLLSSKVFSIPDSLYNYILYKSEAEADLNFDGKKDKIKLTLNLNSDDNFDDFGLEINDAKAFGAHSYNVDGFIIVDVDTTDKFKEVAVHTPNANGPDEFILYRYNGKTIYELGKINSSATFPGNKFVPVSYMMSFWNRTDTMFLNETNEWLKITPKNIYKLSEEASVTEAFKIYKSKNLKDVLRELQPGETVTIISCDTSPECKDEKGYYFDKPCNLYELRLESGETGWAKLGDFMNKVDLPWYP